MNYQSLNFILFAALVCLVYYTVGRKYQKAVLLIANIAFYVIAGFRYLPFLLATMTASFFTAAGIQAVYDRTDAKLAECTDKAEKKALRAQSKKQAHRVLWICFIVAIGLLVVCKYTGFITENVNRILSLTGGPKIDTFNIILPIGISFYTFMAVGYVLDVYWKRYRAESSFFNYAVFLSYFPHIVQGPIDRYNEFSEQLQEPVRFSPDNIRHGAELVIWGLFKKIVIADRIGLFVDGVLSEPSEYASIIIAFTFAVYSIQIYADFSGCIDIVTGVSDALGIKIRDNFNHPYFSKTMEEFWRRWHMSLMEWFRDYVYYPVSSSAFVKNVKKSFRQKGNKRAESLFGTCFPIFVVWCVTGIWHGASWHFVAWGMFHAAVLIMSQICEPLFISMKKFFKVDEENFGWHFLQMARTFFICCVGRIFFRADGLHEAFSLIRMMFNKIDYVSLFEHGLQIGGLDHANVIMAFVSVFVLWAVDMLQEKMNIRETLDRQNLIFRWGIIYLGIFAVVIFGIYGPAYDASAFIYEKF